MVKILPPLTKANWLIIGIFSVFYLLWNTYMIGLRSDHVFFLSFILFCYFMSSWSRQIVHTYAFFILFWILYDSLRLLPNYEINTVHISQPYLMEKFVFGIKDGSKILTPNEYLNLHQSKILDFISGIFYLSWVPVPLLFGLYLFCKKKIYLLEFGAAFLLTNLLGFVLYYSYPAAPPWYFNEYGDVLKFNIPGNTANLSRFDNLVGFQIFSNIYNKNSNVFAAIPSLHSAYPVITLFYCMKYGSNFLKVIFAIMMIGIWFAAVYTNHHYLIDVLLGVVCASFALFLFEKVILKSKFNSGLRTFAKFIDKES